MGRREESSLKSEEWERIIAKLDKSLTQSFYYRNQLAQFRPALRDLTVPEVRCLGILLKMSFDLGYEKCQNTPHSA